MTYANYQLAALLLTLHIKKIESPVHIQEALIVGTTEGVSFFYLDFSINKAIFFSKTANGTQPSFNTSL